MSQKNPIVAINISTVINSPESFKLMHEVGPKVCITTASNPGFLGFEQLLQTGIHPMAGRYGGGAMDMGASLNPMGMYQYTVWKDVKSHEEMHYDNFNRIFELCGKCLSMLVEGPWEPYYEIVASDLPPLTSVTDVPFVMGNAFAQQQEVPKIAMPSQRSIVVGEHVIMDGREAQFETGAKATLQWMKENIPGMIGWMIMKQIGVSAIGSFQLDPNGLMKAASTLGANPPEYGTNYGNTPTDCPPMPAQTPMEYLVHMEWESANHAHMGLGYAFVNYELREIHNEGVLAHIHRGPYYRVFAPFMEQGMWRKKLVK